MKKFFVVASVMLLGFGTFLTSCDDDDDKGGVCECTLYYDGEEVDSEEIDLGSSEVEEYGFEDCSDVEQYLNYEDGYSGYEYECE